MQVINSQLEMTYPAINKWAIQTYGSQNGEDYAHDAVVTILESFDNATTQKLSQNAFLGLWRILITKAYAEARHSLLSRRTVVLSLEDAKTIINPIDKIAQARQLIRHMLPHIPFAGRKVMYRLYVLGETERQCAKALGLSFQRVNQVKQNTILFLGKLVKQSNGGV